MRKAFLAFCLAALASLLALGGGGMMCGARIGGWAKAGHQPLPYLREVAYLESDGNQYIKTTNENNFSRFCELDITVTEIYLGNFAAMICGGSFVYCGWRNGKIYFGNKEKVSSPNVGSRYVVSGNGSSDSSRPFFIFGAANSGGVVEGLSKLRLHSLRLRKGTVSGPWDLCDLIPVLDLNGRPCLYNKVNGELLYNQGTGEFTIGPDKS